MNILNEKRRLQPLSGYMSMGGGGGGGQTTSTSYTSNIPEYARPYVDTMLGATQKQLFNTQEVGGRPAEYATDAEGVRYETRPAEAPTTEITGFKPYQAYGGTYAQAGQAMMTPDGHPVIDASTGKPKTYQGGEQLSYDPSKAIAGFSPLQKQAQSGIADLQLSGDFGQAGQLSGAAGQGALDSANMAYGYGAQGANYGAQGQQSGLLGQQIGQMGLQAQRTGNQIGAQAQDYARQAASAGNQYARQATNPYAMQAYMSPYMQNVVDVQNQEAQRQSGIMGTQQQAEATKAGAFGGGRDAIMRAERERNLATTMNQNQAQGLQSAYQQAQQAQQFGANLGLQGLSGAQQGLGTALQGGQLGLSGIGTALQGTAQGMQGAGVGIQGAQTGLQGVSGAQAGYSGANQAASNMSNIASQEQAAQLGILNAQTTAGAQQQAQQQQIINQSMTDYANAQQYPLMQLGTMSNMLRGLPMQSQTTSQYAAAPNAITQGIGAAGAAASLYNATKAEGGVIKSYASGGITSYDVGGQVEAQLEDMDIDGLKREAKESSSPRIKQMAQRLLAEKQMARAPRMAGGGIIAFSKGDEVEDNLDGMQLAEAVQARDPRVMSDSDGILMADATPRAAAKPALAPAPAPVAKPAPVPAPTPQGIVGNVQKELQGHQETANKSIQDIMAERQALRESLGVGGDAPREELRNSVMAERANLKDEAERQKQMRLAEFFASWGSTPGPVLVAGMNALKKSIPGMVEDQREAKKLRRESDKVIYDIDQATRLEKMGRIDEAAAIKEKAATHAQALNKDLMHYAGTVKTAEAHSANAAATRDAAAATRAASLESKAQDQYRGALTYQNNVMAEIAREKTGKEYLALTKQAQMPETVKGPAAKMRNDAINKLNAIEKEHDERVAEAKKNVEYFGSRAGVPEAKAKDKAAPAPEQEAPKVERPSWVPPEAQYSESDKNWYVKDGRKYKKVVKE